MANQNALDRARQKAIAKLRKSRKQRHSVRELADEIRAGSSRALSSGITLVESLHPDRYAEGQELVSCLYEYSGNSVRVGITGVPGVGKSTFIESFGFLLAEAGHRVAVLAIDPSSQKSRGSILGDKTRMEKLSVHPRAFIRPTAAADTLGGVARSTREAMVLCEAAGYDRILIETVGVGQSETAVHSMTDFFLLLMLAGAGDELQGIKRGIMEMADTIAINKAEGENKKAANEAQRAYKNALHLFPPSDTGWVPQVVTCSALHEVGLTQIKDLIEKHHEKLLAGGHRDRIRTDQAIYWFNTTLNDLWRNYLHSEPRIAAEKSALEQAVKHGEISPFQAAGTLMELLADSTD